MKLSHINKKNIPNMVDISEKKITTRTATAQGTIKISKEITKLFSKNDIHTPKGPVFQTAIIAGTMAVKKTHQLIPFCHQIPIEKCKIKINLNKKNEITIKCTVQSHHKTGVEMEAITGVSITGLTIYDMCKSVSHKMTISDIKLTNKKGGKSNFKSQ